jgi:hypothetical protein
MNNVSLPNMEPDFSNPNHQLDIPDFERFRYHLDEVQPEPDISWYRDLLPFFAFGFLISLIPTLICGLMILIPDCYTMEVVFSILGFLQKFNGSNYGSIVTIILTSYAFSKQNGKDELSDPTSFFKKVYVSETTPTNGVYKINDLLRSSQGILP